jgi:hypothetical protein
MTIDDLPSTIFLDSANFDADDALLAPDNSWMDLDDLDADDELFMMVGTTQDYGEDTTSITEDGFMEEQREVPPPPSSPLPEQQVSSSDFRRAGLKRSDNTSSTSPSPVSSSAAPFTPLTHRQSSSMPPHRVSPERSMSCHSTDSSISALQVQYQDGLRKLAKSMRHSDMTRSVIKRQRIVAPTLSFTSSHSRDSNSHAGTQSLTQDFFLSPRCKELEDSRRKIFRMLSEQSPVAQQQHR